MYKDKEAQKAAVKRAVEKHRGITKGITKQGITPEGITRIPDNMKAVMEALIDPSKRQGLQKIYDSLHAKKLESRVYYGIGGLTFKEVGELLQATA